MAKVLTPKPIITELISAAAYIRMSTARQEDSPERQRRQIDEYALQHGYKIIRWYEDHGMTGTESSKRVDYQQLLVDSTSGAFSAVLIAEMSRMSREDLFTVIPQWGAFRDAGISLVSCTRGVIDFSSMGGFLCAIIDQYSAHDESRKFADRTVSGKLNRVLKGERVGGNRLFGFDRNIVDNTGHVLKRVGFRDQFIKSINCQSVLVPSAEVASVEAIQWAFNHVLTGGSLCSVVTELNRRGLVGVQGKRFHPQTVRQILLNPTYAGMSRSGFKCVGKFSRMSDTHKPILTENTHEGIVDRQTFETVSNMIESRTTTKDNWKTFLLSGLCRCGHCGTPLSGQFTLAKNTYRYTCALHRGTASRTGATPCDVQPAFDGPILELAVIRAWCDIFLIDDVTSQLKLKPVEDTSKHEQKELQSLSTQIALAENNLALAASSSDFKTVSTILAQLRTRETALRDKLARSNRKLADLAPDVLKAVQQLKNARNVLEDWPNVGTKEECDSLLKDLAVVFKKTISSIVLRADIQEFSPSISHVEKMKRRTGVITFNSDHISAPDAILTDTMIAHPFRRQFRKIADYLREEGRPMRYRDIVEKFKDRDVRGVGRALAICKHEGLVKKTAEGWVACD